MGIHILQLKTRVKNLEYELSKRDLTIKILERELKQKQKIEAETELIRKDLVIKLLEKEIDAKDETIEDHKEIFDDICDKTGYEYSWQWQTSPNKWNAYNEEISAKIEELNLNESIKYKTNDGNYQIITKLRKDFGIEENENDENECFKKIRRIEKFCAM